MNSFRISALGERALIRRIARGIRTGRGVVRGIGDDCAVLSDGPGPYQLFASDMLVEGVHFRRTADPALIGWKALAVNVSDVDAMGGVPRHAVVALGLPPSTRVGFVDGLYRGLRRCAKRYGVNLVGGDTVRAPRVVIDVAILGEVEKGRVIYRSGAKVGDALLVTGRLGGSLRSGRHLRFSPRVREARALTAQARLHAMMDLSDGLSQDLPRICRASGVGAVLQGAAIPRHAGCSLTQALTDGEDFELLIASAEEDAGRLLPWAKRNLPCGLHRIGTVVAAKPHSVVTLVAPKGMKVSSSLAGFRHF